MLNADTYDRLKEFYSNYAEDTICLPDTKVCFNAEFVKEAVKEINDLLMRNLMAEQKPNKIEILGLLLLVKLAGE
tara:strand:- start:402 stop:626 length:225 start_codon:yes stop_codon:yes gene_type:complete